MFSRYIYHSDVRLTCICVLNDLANGIRNFPDGQLTKNVIVQDSVIQTHFSHDPISC